MHQFALLLPVLLPVIFWAIYHYNKDRDLPEPVGLLVLVFVLGMLAAGVSRLMYVGLEPLGLRFDASALADSNTLGLLAYALLVIGPIEELSKLIPFLLVVLRFDELDESVDGIIYASFIGLGYAAVENWQYLEYLTTPEAYARGFASPVIHIVFASIWGHWVTQAHLARRSIVGATLASLAIAAGLHGIYDFIVILNPQNSLPVAALIIVSLWLWRLRLMRKLREQASQER